MSLRRDKYERIREVVAAADADEPLTAREILRLLEEHDEEFESAHQVATVLGRRAADAEEVEIIQDQPYRYRFSQSAQ
jgi:predicted Zn-ribbon and HTH transcriptional regulator